MPDPAHIAPIGSQIRTAREAAGLTQEALAAAAGLRQGHLSKIEAGRSEPEAQTLFALADALGLGLVGYTGHWRLVPGDAVEQILRRYPEA